MNLEEPKILIIEPFYTGSHKKMIDLIARSLSPSRYKLITMTGKKWHWRARTSALYISTQIPESHRFEILFCTSVLPLAELLGLRPDLMNTYKVIYFHENQMEFPVRVTKKRDFQYGFNEILSCLAADKVLFNSYFNMNSFLKNIHRHISIQPDYKVPNLNEMIRPKCQVIYYPLDLAFIDRSLELIERVKDDVLHILWPHRWEFDKNPESFYNVLCRLDKNGYKFKVSLLGEAFRNSPSVFEKLIEDLKPRICHTGYVHDEVEYLRILKNADVVVSTATHEFFGVAVMEAVYCDCIPVVPNRLAYRELYQGHVEEIYETDNQLYTTLTQLCHLKQSGDLNRTYREVALAFDSCKWLNMFYAALGLETEGVQDCDEESSSEDDGSRYL